MIKVNLLKGQTKGKKGEDGSTSTAFKAPAKMPKDLPKKLAFFAVPIISAYVFNFVTIKNAESDFKALTDEKNKLVNEVTSLQPQLAQITQYKEQKENILKEIEVIKGLSLDRYQLVKILDALQSILPQKAWLTKLDISYAGVSLEGNSSEDSAISSFIESLEASFYFKDIVWVDSRVTKAENGEEVKSFKFMVKLENL